MRARMLTPRGRRFHHTSYKGGQGAALDASPSYGSPSNAAQHGGIIQNSMEQKKQQNGPPCTSSEEFG